MIADPWTDWQIEPPPDDNWDEGGQYVVDAVCNATENPLWARFIITVTKKCYIDNEPCYTFRVDTAIDGSDGFLDGWDSV